MHANQKRTKQNDDCVRRKLLEELIGPGAEELVELDGVPVAIPKGFDSWGSQAKISSPVMSDKCSFAEFFLEASASTGATGVIAPRVLYALRWGLRHAVVDSKSQAPALQAQEEARRRRDDIQQQCAQAIRSIEDGVTTLSKLADEELLGHRGPDYAEKMFRGREQIPSLVRAKGRNRTRELVGRAESALRDLKANVVLLLPSAPIMSVEIPYCVRSLVEGLWTIEGIEVKRKFPKRLYAATAFVRAGLTPRQAAAVCALDVGMPGFAEFGEASMLLDPADHEESVVAQWAWVMREVPMAALKAQAVRRAVFRRELRPYWGPGVRSFSLADDRKNNSNGALYGSPQSGHSFVNAM